MKKKVIFVAIAIIAMMCGMGLKSHNQKMQESLINFSETEALTSCEQVDGQKSNGHCVRNDAYQYFCAKAGFLQSKNCYQ